MTRGHPQKGKKMDTWVYLTFSGKKEVPLFPPEKKKKGDQLLVVLGRKLDFFLQERKKEEGREKSPTLPPKNPSLPKWEGKIRSSNKKEERKKRDTIPPEGAIDSPQYGDGPQTGREGKKEDSTWDKGGGGGSGGGA